MLWNEPFEKRENCTASCAAGILPAAHFFLGRIPPNARLRIFQRCMVVFSVVTGIIEICVVVLIFVEAASVY